MKRILLLLTLLFLTLSKSSGQTYYPFPTDSATWSVEQYAYAMFPYSDACIAEHYGFAGDTIIDGKNYSKLFGNNLNSPIPPNDTTFNISTATYAAAIREDTTKKVWVRRPNDTLEILYYDFALNIGDTFCFNYFYAGCYPVSYVDSILINGNYRRQIQFYTDDGNETWIEGIGSKTGWFAWHWPGSYGWTLLCYSENQNQLYGTSYCHCDTYTGILYLNSESDGIIVFPNPTSDFIYLKNAKDEMEYKILDNTGRTILSGKTEKVPIAIGINVQTLSPGFYRIVFPDMVNRAFIKL